MSKKIPSADEEILINTGRAVKAQQNQLESVEQQVFQVNRNLNILEKNNEEDSANIDDLIKQFDEFAKKNNIDLSNLTNDELEKGSQLAEFDKIHITNNLSGYERIDFSETIQGDISGNWDSYIDNVYKYMNRYHLDTVSDPYEELLSYKEKEDFKKRVHSDYYDSKPNCDKWDYIFSALCGISAGLIDSFLVGSPNNSVLGKEVDKFTDGIVKKVAKLSGWNPKEKNIDSVASAIGFLERKFNVNYDARYASDLANPDLISGMNPLNHHIKSLSHSPDLVGLIFSVIDQFTGTASFIDNGKLIRLEPVKNGFELKGSNLIAKVFSAIVNWFGHIMSDIAGSSGTRGHSTSKRGAGVSMPGFELFQFMNFGNIGQDSMTFAQFSVKMFENGYDARFGATMAIPVLIAEVLSSVSWLFLQRFHHHKEWKDLNPLIKQPELLRMKLVSHGCLCLCDVADAAIRSGGNPLEFALHINIVALGKFAQIGFKEIRAIYGRNHINLDLLESDVNAEWQRIYATQF